MLKASDILRQGKTTIAETAMNVGYESEADSQSIQNVIGSFQKGMSSSWVLAMGGSGYP
jgi:hypothetical protein